MCIQIIIITMLAKILYLEQTIKIVLGLSVLLLIAEGLIAYYEICRNPDARWYKLLAAYRAQRHDFHNHLQIIYGMIQLKKYDRAISYINNIKTIDSVYERICHLENQALVCNLLEAVNLFRKFEIDVTIEAVENVNINRISSADLIKKANAIISRLNESNGPKKVRIVLNKTRAEFCLFNENSFTA
jgi:hypothetical protein